MQSTQYISKSCSSVFSIYPETLLFCHLHCYHLFPAPSPFVWITAVASEFGSLFLSLNTQSLPTQRDLSRPLIIWYLYSAQDLPESASLVLSLCHRGSLICDLVSYSSLLVPSTPAIRAPLLFCESTKLTPTPGHLYLISPLPSVVFSQISLWLMSHFLEVCAQLSPSQVGLHDCLSKTHYSQSPSLYFLLLTYLFFISLS